MKYFYFDCKTGGNKPKMSLFSLYGVVLNENFKSIDTVDLKIKPNNGQYTFNVKHLLENNIDIVKHDNEAINQLEASKKFNNFCFMHGNLSKTKLIPIGCNLSYKLPFIKKYLLSEKEIRRAFLDKEIDILKISNFLKCVKILPENLDCNLYSIAKYFNIPFIHNEQNDKIIANTTINVLKTLINLTNKQQQ